jgi:hypothetical protein
MMGGAPAGSEPGFGGASAQPSPRTGGSARWVYWTAWAGLAYAAVWIVGLFVAPAAPDAFGSAAEINKYFVDHRSAALIQSVLIHGVAGVALVVFAAALWGYLGDDNAVAIPRRLMLVFAVLAAAVSFLQVIFMISIYRRVGQHGSANGTKTLFNAINKADTAKLILLAAFIAAASYAGYRRAIIPRWLVFVGGVAVVFLVVGGLAFVVDSGVLSAALDVSLLLLLLWAAATSIVIIRRDSRTLSRVA